MLECFDLAGKVAFVTGGSQGIGLGIAKAFAQSGANVSIISRSPEKLASVAAEIEGLGVRCVWHAADIEDYDAVKTAVDKTVSAFGRVDFLINNAVPKTPHEPLLEVPIESFHKAVDAILVGAFTVSRIVVEHMIAQNFGKIVNIATIASDCCHGHTHPGAYETAKHGIRALTRCMAYEWSQYGINVNTISPGYINKDCLAPSEMSAASLEIAQQVPMKRFGTVEEIAAACVFLCSEGATFVQGTDLIIDGGRVYI